MIENLCSRNLGEDLLEVIYSDVVPHKQLPPGDSEGVSIFRNQKRPQ